MPMTERFAIYYAPAPRSALAERAAAWLERDPAGGEVPPTDTPGLPRDRRLALSRSARRYGFHATLKAPFALAAGRTRDELEAALTAFTLRHRPVGVGKLVLADLEGFLALVPETQSPALTDFARQCVAAFEMFRAPLSAEDRARRIAAGLTAYQVGLLDHYGYPYVMDEFRFHLTLTDRLPADDRDAVTEAARRWFAPLLGEPVMLDRLTLFHEPGPGADFRRIADFPLSTRVPV
jgi:putative phosphonate metabolism protein